MFKKSRNAGRHDGIRSVINASNSTVSWEMNENMSPEEKSIHFESIVSVIQGFTGLHVGVGQAQLQLYRSS